MKKDLIVLGILVGGIVFLVVLALLGIAFLPQPQEITADMPEAVVYNFYLALDNKEYEKAYGYLCASDQTSVSLARFRNRVVERRGYNQLYCVECKDTEVHGDQAFVTVRFTYSYESSPLQRYEYSSERTVALVREGEAWRLKQPPASYWW
jgi:hypothetical protein